MQLGICRLVKLLYKSRSADTSTSDKTTLHVLKLGASFRRRIQLPMQHTTLVRIFFAVPKAKVLRTPGAIL